MHTAEVESNDEDGGGIGDFHQDRSTNSTLAADSPIQKKTEPKCINMESDLGELKKSEEGTKYIRRY